MLNFAGEKLERVWQASQSSLPVCPWWASAWQSVQRLNGSPRKTAFCPGKGPWQARQLTVRWAPTRGNRVFWWKAILLTLAFMIFHPLTVWQPSQFSPNFPLWGSAWQSRHRACLTGLKTS